MTKKPSLNPSAASYVPVSSRRPVTGSEHESKGRNDAAAAASAIRPVHQNTSASSSKPPDRHPGCESIASSSSSSQHQVPETALSWVEDFEGDVAQLQKTFPGFSHDSLVHVYISNMFDLDATIDIINQAKIDVPPSLDNPIIDFLPENLDFDVREYLSKSDEPGEGESSKSSPSAR
ncbi:hypothetical protein M569_06647 [Genlisea aurea]|uniref:CUE domain-containing protein n=1 Tax=Genlisea aurea TaxID=192259 RepID=S8DXX2_9LAMI|nr:hypothetical protein M569_06647 [Genlisea aurea]